MDKIGKFTGILIVIVFFFTNCKSDQMEVEFTGKTIQILATDGLPIMADLYECGQENAPYIILFHQANFSRGEYRPIAPKLNQLGFNCLAIDQRSGNEVNGVENETHKRAISANKETQYIDALADVEGAFLYIKNELKAEKIMLWGSSYSASLTLYMASQHSDELIGMLAFSPGEYFKIDNQEIKDYAAQIKCPVFISSSKNEEEKWKKIFEAIPSPDKTYYLPKDKGFHGSRALWSINEGHEDAWKAVEAFLSKVK